MIDHVGYRVEELPVRLRGYERRRCGHVASRPVDVDLATLTPIVRRSLRSNSVEIDAWEVSQLYGGRWGSGLFRLAGRGLDDGRVVAWSIRRSSLPVSRDPLGARSAS
jgi:hypothetical protein